ncbi:unnamed protein product [Alopecurus aequalis]
MQVTIQKKRSGEDAGVLPRLAPQWTDKKSRWGFSRHLGSGSPEDDRRDAKRKPSRRGSSADERWDAHKLGCGRSTADDEDWTKTKLTEKKASRRGSSADERWDAHKLGCGRSAADHEDWRKLEVEDDEEEEEDEDKTFAGPTFIQSPDPGELPSPILLLLPACACELLMLPTCDCKPKSKPEYVWCY